MPSRRARVWAVPSWVFGDGSTAPQVRVAGGETEPCLSCGNVQESGQQRGLTGSASTCSLPEVGLEAVIGHCGWKMWLGISGLTGGRFSAPCCAGALCRPGLGLLSILSCEPLGDFAVSMYHTLLSFIR